MSYPHSADTAPVLPPIFMFGFERSGTTLLSMMVGAHPDIAVPLSVTGLWFRYGHRLDLYNQLAEPDDVKRLVDDLLAEERIRMWDVGLDRDALLDGLEPGGFGAVIAKFHEVYARAKGKPFWANLDIATLDHLDDAYRWCPDARFVHIVRDGRDVALSHETMPYGASNTLDCAEQWVQRLHANLKMGAMLDPKRYRVIRFEDLVLDSEKTLSGLCKFFGIDYSPAMLEYGSMVSEKVPENRRWLWPDLDKAPVKNKVGQWKQRMSESRRLVFEGAASSMLKDLGYEAYETIPKRPLAYLYEGWCLLDRGSRVRRLGARVGLKRESKLKRSWTSAQRSDADGYQKIQTAAFGDLVKQGVYSERFEHGQIQKDFFRENIEYAVGHMDRGKAISILDCGCGPGAWLDFVHEIEGSSATQLFGFDLTPELVDVAQERLDGVVPREHLQVGDILEDASYELAGPNSRYNLIYTYDVIQQLPRKLQFDACGAMLNRIAGGGCLIIFDHDSESIYGRSMGWRKFVTRNLGVELVPRYYCNASYPPLARFARRIEAIGKFSAEIRVASDGRKRALIVRNLG